MSTRRTMRRLHCSLRYGEDSACRTRLHHAACYSHEAAMRAPECRGADDDAADKQGEAVCGIVREERAGERSSGRRGGA